MRSEVTTASNIAHLCHYGSIIFKLIPEYVDVFSIYVCPRKLKTLFINPFTAKLIKLLSCGSVAEVKTSTSVYVPWF